MIENDDKLLADERRIQQEPDDTTMDFFILTTIQLILKTNEEMYQKFF